MPDESMFAFPTITPEDIPSAEPAPEPEVPEVETFEEPEAPETEPEEEPETEEGASEEEGTEPKEPLQKQTPSEIRKSLKDLQAANPEAARALKAASDAIGRAEAIDKIFPKRMVDGQMVGGITEAQAYKTAIDSAGGLQEIAKFQSIATSVEETDAMLAEGNPEILKQIAEDAPDGFVRLAPAYIKQVHEMALAKARAGDPSALNDLESALQPHSINYLKSAQFEQFISYLQNNVVSVEDAKFAANKLKAWWDAENEKASKSGTEAPDPRLDALSKREQEFNQREEQAFTKDVGSAIVSHTNKELGQRLVPYFKNNPNLSAAQKADIANSLYRALDAEIRADAVGSMQMKSLMKKRDMDKAVSHGKTAITANADKVVEKVMKLYGLSAAKVAAPRPRVLSKPTTPDTKVVPKVQSNKPIRVTQKPDRSLWDTQKTTEDMIFRGECILTNGKYVKWR